MRKLLPTLLSSSLLLALFASAASAEVRTETFRVGPITVDGYEVKQNDFSADAILSGRAYIPKPKVDGKITAMETDVVDVRTGKPVGIQRLMLHHIVFVNMGPTLGSKHDATCRDITMLDSQTKVPALAERFYARGEEGARMFMPPGYGYESKADDKWLMTWMLMNHRKQVDTAYIEYKVTYDTDPAVTNVTPLWLDVENCQSDPVFSVPGGRAPGSTFRRSADWAPQEPGRIIAGGGHVHGGARNLTLTQPRCANREIGRSDPIWGAPEHPFYNVKPILHEPGPIKMSGWVSRQGIPVAAGSPLRLNANYDGQYVHTRVMGIMMVYFVPDSRVTTDCGPLPTDRVVGDNTGAGRRKPPVFPVPLTGLDSNGRAVQISRPPGRTVRFGSSGTTIAVRDQSISRRNISVPRGATVAWEFGAGNSLLHDVTIANGPRGFHSPHLNGGRTFSKRLTVPGTYRLFCSLHPVAMTQTVTVRRGS